MAHRRPSIAAKWLALMMSVGGMLLPTASLAGPPDLRITTRDGTRIALEAEDLRGPSARPLAATRDRLHERFKKEFIWFFKSRIPDGTPVVGRWTADRGPLRVTMYEITKNEGAPRWLRVVGTQVYRKSEVAEFRSDFKKSHEHVYLVTAEAVASDRDLNPHLRYMNAQGDSILLQGYGTNWNLSVLKFRILEKGATGTGDVEFAKDADWLVSNLLDPQWIVSIRIE